MANYTVKLVKEGPDKGKWGVYRGSTLTMAFKSQSAANSDAKAKNKATS